MSRMAKKHATAMFEFLGTGTSTGVPVAGCDCEVCCSRDWHDKRLRSSALIRHGQRQLVIDTGPEFRIQCLRAGIMNLSAVLLTHDHADHLNGFDDVRAFSYFKDKRLPVWASADTIKSIRRRFDYIWNAQQIGGGLPDVELHTADKPFRIIGIDIVPIPIMHGKLPILGFRIGDLAYLTDISSLPDSSLPLLANLGTLIISCVRYRFHRTHLNIAGAKRLHRLIQPERTLMTHLTHYIAHKELIAALPADMTPAHDGLKVEINLP